MVQVADVVYRIREEALPETCPKCGTSLRGDGVVNCFEYDTIKKRVAIDATGAVNWDDHVYGPGEESPVPPVEYRCAHCDCTLLSGTETEEVIKVVEEAHADS